MGKPLAGLDKDNNNCPETTQVWKGYLLFFVVLSWWSVFGLGFWGVWGFFCLVLGGYVVILELLREQSLDAFKSLDLSKS